MPLPAAPISLETNGSNRTKQEQFRSIVSESLVETIAAKLDIVGGQRFADTIRDCHTRIVYQVCVSCGRKVTLINHCDCGWCPMCQPRLAKKRAKSVQWWTRQLVQPKHVVLTQPNIETITSGALHEFRAKFRALRRRSLARNWQGGFWSIEVTNEGRGWHIHLHCLVEAKWIDKAELQRVWSDLIGHPQCIVHVKDARGTSYLDEVCKYAVKGNQLATWQPHEILAYVTAAQGVRMFGTFGSLFKLSSAHNAWLESENAKQRLCECGCNRFRYYDEHDLLLQELVAPFKGPTTLDDFAVVHDNQTFFPV